MRLFSPQIKSARSRSAILCAKSGGKDELSYTRGKVRTRVLVHGVALSEPAMRVAQARAVECLDAQYPITTGGEDAISRKGDHTYRKRKRAH